MHLILLFIFALVPIVLADDDWEDFTNNLATDLAPLITLFGERLTKQFLSESITLVDNLIFALSPLGVLTTVVSVIRVCGGSSLRAFIGRAQEGPAEAESELLPCVSESTAELFNDRGISRVFGRPKVLEIVVWDNEDVKTGERSVELGTLLDAVTKGAWSVKGSGHSPEDWCRVADVNIPNLSLNKGIKRRRMTWFYCAAILGSALQIGVIVYATVTVFISPGDFKKNDKAVPSYAFPFYIIGTTFLFLGMFSSAVIIERSSKKSLIEPNKMSKLYWLQPGNQIVGDQVFDAFLAVEEDPNHGMTKDLQYIKSIRGHNIDGQNVKVYLTIISTIFGFVIQFIGLRALHASVILASLGATLVMSILRTCLRTERMAPGENILKEDRKLTSHKQQELDFFAFHLEEVESFGLLSDPSSDAFSENLSLQQSVGPEESLIQRLIQTRKNLAKLTSRSDDGSTVAWDDTPIRTVAHRLAETIELTMDSISNWEIDFGESVEFPLSFECRSKLPECETPLRGTYSIRLESFGNPLRWHVDTNEVEAILGLWTWSLFKLDGNWHRPLSRLVGLNETEAGKKETFLYFHKWIFRQKEATMASSKMIDSSRRLFGFKSDESSLDRDILIMETENDLETMVAQDIYTRFLQDVLSHLNELGGDVDVNTGLQDFYIFENSRINELMYCFERCSLGSREDALLCIVPVLRQRNLLPELAADTTGIRKRIETAICDNDWTSALGIAFSVCGCSEGPEFERSVYELGYLCRRALLSKDIKAQEAGSTFVLKLSKSDVRELFMGGKRISMPATWSESPEYIQWWDSFSKQLGWVAWHISALGYRPAWREASCPIERDIFQGNVHDLPLCVGPDPDDLNDVPPGASSMREWLVDDVNVDHDFSGEEAFQWALQEEHNALLYFILLRWVEVGEKYPNVIQLAYTVAAKSRSSWSIRVLQRRDTVIDTMNDNKVSALMEVTAAGDFDAVQTLLEAGANPDGDDEVPDARPLLWAAHEGRTDIVELLLQHNAKLEILDNMRQSALHWARKANQLDVVRLLLSHGIEIESWGLNFETVLHSTAMEGQLEMAKLLLKHGAKIDKGDGNFGFTSLILAARSSPDDMLCPQVDMIRLLLSEGANVFVRDNDGLTARDWARRRGFDDTVALLESAENSATM